MEFAQYWQYTDAITKALFFILILLSVLSWVTGILRLISSYKMRNTVASTLDNAVAKHSAQFASVDYAQRKMGLEQVLLQAIARIRHNAEKGMQILGTTAAIAPFIGLFGTVWGIFHALHKIGQTGQAGLAQVSGPVGEALIMTALGLAVAIPALVFFNMISRVNRNVLHKANDRAHELLASSILKSDS